MYHQFICDQYSKIELERLNFIRFNQSTLKALNYKGLTDTGLDGESQGVPIVLPSTFAGGPRYMMQCFQDSMAIVRDKGRPDIFTTFTCNPKWNEITVELEKNQLAHDRPDIIVKVFNQKLKSYLNDITKKQIYGRTIGYLHVIEFQKRGLPHAHILIILAPEVKIKTIEDVDALVSAELPDPDEFPNLFETVKTCMMHGPCGKDFPDAVCMVEGKCSENFPKEFSEFSELKTTR